MEDDDEFGDLYTDVLRPLTTQSQPQREESGAAAAAGNASSSQSHPIDLNVNREDEEILYGAADLKNSNLNPVSNPSSALGRNLDVPIQEKTLQGSRGFDLNLDSTSGAAKVDGLAGEGGDGLGFDARVLEKDEGVKLPQKASGGPNFMEDDDDINILVEERENKDEDLVVKDDNFINKEDNLYISATQKENTVGFMNGSVVDDMGSAQIIPGLSGRSENPRGSNFEDDWESEESEDDLQIVLNENNHASMRMGMERMPGGIDEDDDDGDQLLIVADNGDMVHHHHQPQMVMEDQEWGGEEGGPGANGEKDLGDAAKASGGGSAVPAAQPKIAYNNQVYHHPFHSQFKVSILFDENFKCQLDSSGNCSFNIVKLWMLVTLKVVTNVVDELLCHGGGILNCTDFDLSFVNEVMHFLNFFFPKSFYFKLFWLMMLVYNEIEF